MGEDESVAGQVLANKYLLIDRLGEGGFGSIWRAEHQVLKSPVAVKLIDLDMARKDGAVERFLREAQATAALRSPHVVQVLDYGVDGNQPFIVMELLEGENLADRIQRVGVLPPLEVVRIVTHVARAIGKAQELGIVHRDLKPENIFLVNNGDEEIAKVLDFGVAKIASPVEFEQKTRTKTGSLVGTPYYMSPEQVQGNKSVDHRSDLWALGVIAFEMMTGRRPFDGEALGDLVLTICVRSIAVPSSVAAVPAGFDAWFARAVERDPDARFQSSREMALALLQVVEGEEAGIRYTNIDERVSRKPSASESGIGTEIPSRPNTSAFALTVRDRVSTSEVMGTGSPLPSPGDPSASNHATEPEERLTPWSLVGIAVLALAAGAAAVYGVFFLVRAHDASNDVAIGYSPPTSAHPRAASAASAGSGTKKHRVDVAPPGRSQRSTPDASSMVNGPTGAASVSPASEPSRTPSPMTTSPMPSGSTVATAAQPAPPPIAPPAAPPPENLAPTIAPIAVPAPIPALSAETQPLSVAVPGADDGVSVNPTETGDRTLDKSEP
jgi:eukaryotic-like serine/threonine-protein kinase